MLLFVILFISAKPRSPSPTSSSSSESSSSNSSCSNKKRHRKGRNKRKEGSPPPHHHEQHVWTQRTTNLNRAVPRPLHAQCNVGGISSDDATQIVSSSLVSRRQVSWAWVVMCWGKRKMFSVRFFFNFCGKEQ